jgi:hypothetical protein
MNDPVSAKAAAAATYSGSAAAIFFGLTANEFAALGGLAVGVVGLVVTIWFKHQHLQLAKKMLKPTIEE